MEKNKDIKLLLIIIMASVTILFAIMLIIPRFKGKETLKYRLQSSDGIIAIYFGDELIEKYDEIILSNLPFSDRTSLEHGLEFNTLEEAQKALEDFDG